MPIFDDSHHLRIQLDTQGCDLSAAEIAEMEESLHTLRQVVQNFPVAVLTITVIYHPRRNDFHVKTSLALTGTTLFTGDRDMLMHTAYERCIHKLVRKAKAFKQQLRGEVDLTQQASGTHPTISPTQDFDVTKLEEAVSRDDYAAFRRAADVFEESLTRRIGRWIQRYPAMEAQLGETITISDIVEDVFLLAFHQFANRPRAMAPGSWFESLIDCCVQALLQTPDEEFANISFARAALEHKV